MRNNETEIEARVDHSSSSLCIQDNALIRSAYTMTLLEKRLLMLAISKINAATAPLRGQPIKVTVYADEWADLYRENDPWTDLARAADRLMGRVVIIHPCGMKRRKLNWTDSCEYYDSKVVIKFGYSISIELAGMLDEFTQTDLLDVAKLDSFYAVRLYELLMQFASTGILMITVEELRAVMHTTDKYPRFAQFNQRVIKTAVADIQRRMPHLNLDVEYIKRKHSRSVTSINFTFTRTVQPDLFKDQSEQKQPERDPNQPLSKREKSTLLSSLDHDF